MIYIITGFPRSGTSMMMEALEAGGMTLAYNTDRDRIKTVSIHLDEHYQVNPSSLYEFTAAEMRQPGFPRTHDGCVVKIPSLFLSAMAVHEYQVIFMLRDTEEIRQSYQTAFGRDMSAGMIERQVAESLLHVKNRKDCRLTEVEYRSVIDDPNGTFLRLHDLGWPINPNEAARIVDPTRYRFRREILTAGARGS